MRRVESRMLAVSPYRSAPDVPLTLGPDVVDPVRLRNAFENPDAEAHLVLRDHGRNMRGGLIE